MLISDIFYLGNSLLLSNVINLKNRLGVAESSSSSFSKIALKDSMRMVE